MPAVVTWVTTAGFASGRTVISRLSPSFWRGLRTINAAEQKAALRAYRLFVQNPSHNSLRFKKLTGHANPVVGAGDHRRAPGRGHRDGEMITWV